jgi:nucleotide-binding universal stress UspA family protein
MLRSILVGLDGSAYGEAAVEIGLRWAAEFDAQLVGYAVIAEPYLTEAEATPLGAGYYPGSRDERTMAAARERAGRVLDRFARRFAAAGVAGRPVEGVGPPAELILAEAQRHDLIMLGRRTFFHFDGTDDPDDTPEEVLHKPPRPVVVVPEVVGGGESVVVAYDGGLEAARAVAAFRATGIGTRFPTHVVTVHEDAAEAARVAGRAVEYLSRHRVAAEARPVAASGDEGEQLLTEVDRYNAHLLVMGAFGHSAWHDFFFGCTTKSVLKGTRVPVFLFH